jgi:DNA-binding transcriptional LysR family regulator
LGVALFHRNSRGASLTQAGHEFVNRAREILQLTEALESEMSFYAGLRRGTLDLGIITSLQCINFGGLLSAFCASYPDVSVNIVQGGTHNLARQLSERKLDLAILNKPLNGLPVGLEFLNLGEDIYHLAVPDNHPLANQTEVSLSELADERFIFHQTGQVAAELSLKACREAGFEPNIVCRCGSPTTGLYMVQGGLGIALLPSEEFKSRTLGGIVELKLKETIRKEVGVAWRKDTASPLVEATVRFAKEWVDYA